MLVIVRDKEAISFAPVSRRSIVDFCRKSALLCVVMILVVTYAVGPRERYLLTSKLHRSLALLVLSSCFR